MSTIRLLLTFAVVVTLAMPSEALAQRGNGRRGSGGMGMMQGGRPARGQMPSAGRGATNMMQGDCMRGSAGGAGMNQAGQRGMMQQQMARFAAGPRSGQQAMNQNTPPSNLERQMVRQFMQTAGRFDEDQNRLLSSSEMERLAEALLEELQGARPLQRNVRSSAELKQPMQELNRQFVQRAMRFDADNDESLSAEETQRMALALVRSLK